MFSVGELGQARDIALDAALNTVLQVAFPNFGGFYQFLPQTIREDVRTFTLGVATAELTCAMEEPERTTTCCDSFGMIEDYPWATIGGYDSIRNTNESEDGYRYYEPSADDSYMIVEEGRPVFYQFGIRERDFRGEERDDHLVTFLRGERSDESGEWIVNAVWAESGRRVVFNQDWDCRVDGPDYAEFTIWVGDYTNVLRPLDIQFEQNFDYCEVGACLLAGRLRVRTPQMEEWSNWMYDHGHLDPLLDNEDL